MAHLIKVVNNLTYWSDKEDQVWVNQTADAKSYSTKAAAEKALKEVVESSGYSNLEVVSSSDALSVEIPVVEEEVAPAVESTLTAEQLRQQAS